jgi:hypothetical protein
MSFKEWLRAREMLSPVPFPSITNMSPEVGSKLKIYTAFNTGEAKVPRWRKRMPKKGSQDGDWR